jgi:hypothetical protein
LRTPRARSRSWWRRWLLALITTWRLFRVRAARDLRLDAKEASTFEFHESLPWKPPLAATLWVAYLVYQRALRHPEYDGVGIVSTTLGLFTFMVACTRPAANGICANSEALFLRRGLTGVAYRFVWDGLAVARAAAA